MKPASFLALSVSLVLTAASAQAVDLTCGAGASVTVLNPDVYMGYTLSTAPGRGVLEVSASGGPWNTIAAGGNVSFGGSVMIRYRNTDPTATSDAFTIANTFAGTSYPHNVTVSGSVPPPKATSTTTAGVTITYSASAQSIQVEAWVSSTAQVNEGVMSISIPGAGPAVTCAVGAGHAVTNFIVSGGTPSGNYIITATYLGTSNFAVSAGNNILAINYFLTSTTVGDRSLNFDPAGQSLGLTASVVSPFGGTVNVGSVTFTISDGGTTIGSAVTSGTLSAGSASVTYLIPAGTSAGTYSITASYNAAGNFAPSADGAVLTINKLNQSISFGALSAVQYGVAPLTLSASGGASGNPVTFSVASGPGSISGSTLTVTGAGTIVIDANQAANANYNAAPTVTQSLSVTAVPLSVAAQAQTKLYGAALPALTFVPNGLVNGDTAATALTGTLATSASAASAIGSYPITQGTLAASSNYILSFTGASLTVTVAPLTITADAQTKAYGAALPTLTFAATGLVNGDTLATALTGALSVGATASSPVASYPISQGSLVASANYQLNYVGANLTVTSVPLTVSATAQSKLYGAALPALTFGNSGLTNGDTAATALSGALSTTATVNSAVGTYPITVGSLAASANYSLIFVGANMSVTAAPLTVTADAQTKVYGAVLPALTFSTSGLVNGDTPAILSGALSTSATAASPVGTFPIAQGTLSAANYTLAFTGANLTVTPAPLSVTAQAQTKLYGAALPALTFATSGLVNGDTVGTALSGALSSSATASSAVGSYPITLGTLAASGNYTLSFTGANLTVTSSALTVVADAQTKLYGAGLPALTFTVTGLVNGDTAATALSGALATSATAGSPVGTYAIAQGSLTASGNYALTFAGANLTVTVAPLAVSTDAQTKVYGAALPALTFSTSGLVNGDTAAMALSGTLATTATTSSPVGTYAITQGTLSATNYALSYTGANLTVVPAVLTIAANDQARVFGAPNPILTVSYSGFVNGESIADLTSPASAGTAAIAGSLPGTYRIVASGGSATNYVLVYVDGVLAVSKAAVTLGLASSSNPAAFSEMVTLTATLSALAPSTAVPTGDLRFTIDGVAQTPVPLVAGSAALSLSALPVGLHNIEAFYAGEAGFMPAAASLTQRVGHLTPTALPQSLVTAQDRPLAIGLEGVSHDSTPLVFSVMEPPAHGTLSGSPPSLTYTPQAGFVGTDQFSFVASAGSLSSPPAMVSLLIAPAPMFLSPPLVAPNPGVVGQELTFQAFPAVVSGSTLTTWDFGDGLSALGNVVAHTYSAPGSYTVTVTATSAQGLSSSVQTSVFVAAPLTSPTGGNLGNTPLRPVVLSNLNGLSAVSQLGDRSFGYLLVNHVQRRRTSFSARVTGVKFDASVVRSQMSGQAGTLVLGSGALARSYSLTLNARGKARGPQLTNFRLDVENGSLLFRIGRDAAFTALVEALGASAPAADRRIQLPMTLQIGASVYVATTFELAYTDQGKVGAGRRTAP